MTENQKLREALQRLLTRYTGLVNSGDAGHWNPEHEYEVISARQALALPTADHIPDTGEMVNGLTQAETDASASVSGLTAAPVGERELPPVIAYRLDYPAPEGVGLPRFFGADDGERAHTFAFNHKATITELCDRAALSAGDAVDAGKFQKLFEAMDEGRASIIVEGATRSIDGGEIFTDIDDALDAIDAAMRKAKT